MKILDPYPWHTKKSETVREWKTPSGLWAKIKLSPLGYFHGYVELPWHAKGIYHDSPLFGHIKVHGGLLPCSLDTVSFHCGHYMDGNHPEYDGPCPLYGVYRDRKYVSKECERLASQLWDLKFVLRCYWHKLFGSVGEFS